MYDAKTAEGYLRHIPAKLGALNVVEDCHALVSSFTWCTGTEIITADFRYSKQRVQQDGPSSVVHFIGLQS